ncbi:hypothetical protein ACEN2T_17160 [Pseudomonas sp. W22_MBD1_FP4]|uniref:hypothetical protein n=1 Tax=Pseudomonas sp. W22_MBD1_FP4 TaxID=3240272 RepID=UPI003F9644C6
MKTKLKVLLVAAVVATAAALTGCNTTETFLASGQSRFDSDHAGYETVTGERNYMSVSPEYYVHGS